MLLQATEMFTLLGRSGLDEELLAWVWEHSSMGGVSFVTVGPNVYEDGGFSQEQGIVALYLAQMQAGLALDAFVQKMRSTSTYRFLLYSVHSCC
jgi:hypothetical protein